MHLGQEKVLDCELGWNLYDANVVGNTPGCTTFREHGQGISMNVPHVRR
jgi:hypothetical protein